MTPEQAVAVLNGAGYLNVTWRVGGDKKTARWAFAVDSPHPLSLEPFALIAIAQKYQRDGYWDRIAKVGRQPMMEPD